MLSISRIEDFSIAARRRRVEAEAAGDLAVEVKQPRLVDAARSQLGLHLAVELEMFWQEVQAALLFAEHFIAFVELFIELPLADGLAIRHHHHRAGRRRRA